MAGIESFDPYSWFVGMHEHLMPSLQDIYWAQQEAEHNHCGYSMKLGRPGTFRANRWVPYGQIIVMDIDALEEEWKTTSSTSLYRFVDGELNINNMLEQTWVAPYSSSVMDILKSYRA